MSNSIGKVARAINKSVLAGSKRALSKAITKTKSKLKKDLKFDTGLKNEILDKRVNSFKPKGKFLRGSVNVAVKYPIQLSEFKPSVKKVKVNKRTYYGATVKIGKNPRGLVPGGFIQTAASGKDLVFTRKPKSEFSLTERIVGLIKGIARYPIKAMTSDILKVSATTRQGQATKYLKQIFDSTYKAEVDKELDKNMKKLTDT